MRRREFIAGLDAVDWPLTARAAARSASAPGLCSTSWRCRSGAGASRRLARLMRDLGWSARSHARTYSAFARRRCGRDHRQHLQRPAVSNRSRRHDGSDRSVVVARYQGCRNRGGLRCRSNAKQPENLEHNTIKTLTLVLCRDQLLCR
jgi:hypothetical protein